MKRRMLTGMAFLCIALGVFGQGSIDLDNSAYVNYGVAINTPGNYYGGTYGIEVWELSGDPTSVPPGININPTVGSGVMAYNAMVASGFVKEATISNQTMPAGSGILILGPVFMPDVTPIASTVVLALAVWNTSAPSWAAMLSTANANTRAGVVAFLNPTAYYTGNPSLPDKITGWNSVGDLVMAAIPKPSISALAALGAAIVWAFRRWR
jgi:hypothetical protein